MPKDRRIVLDLAEDARIVFERSSAHPVEYAVLLLIFRDGKWHTVRAFDNAHDVEEHHEHRYVGDEKQPPIITRGPVNQAMHNALYGLIENWRAIADQWEETR
jgi:hypothetical protein